MLESTKEIKNYRGIKCLNCNHPLDISDKFCPNCGQKNTTKRLSLKDFVDEFLANFYAYDSKVKHTITSLFVKPGKSARDFINGKRHYYANPFRFYLSVSLIYFIFSGLVEKFGSESSSDLDLVPISKENKSDKKSKPDESQNLLVVNDTVGQVQIKSDGLNIQQDTIKKDTLYTEKQIAHFGFFKRSVHKMQTYSAFFEKSKQVNPIKILDTLKHENCRWNRYLLKKTYQFNKLNEEDNSGKKGVEKFVEYIEDKFPFILFVSLPFLTVVFALIYFRRKLYYAEHMVFVFSIMSFVFLLIFLKDIIMLLFNIDLSIIISLGLAFYFYKSLRNFYQQSRWKTILKFVILSFLLPITASFVALFVLFIGFLLY